MQRAKLRADVKGGRGLADADINRLDGQVAIVTGASSGIGAGTAKALAAAWAAVCVNYYGSPDDAESVVAEIGKTGGRAVAVAADVSEEAEVIAMFDQVEKEFGPLDILFSNAGIQIDAPTTELALKDWNRVIAVNLTGGFLCAREAIRRFRKKGMRPAVSRALGKIVFNSSVHEIIPWGGHVNYCASKGGLALLMKSLAQEVAGEGIRVNSVAPGAIRTNINREALKNSKPPIEEMIPYGRVGEAADIARVVVWLCSDAADYVVGHALFADGGMVLYPQFLEGG
jgi:glucose 1-dehydrogenase